jgi:hypothetical protein
MDTRRRSDARERMSTPPAAGTPEPQGDAGSETKIVKLTDIQPAGGLGGGMNPAFLVATVAVAVISFALGAGLPRATPTPSPSAPSIALASSNPTPLPSPTPTEAPSTPPTPRPTTPPAWAWTRHVLLPTDAISLNETGAWGIGNLILVLAQRVFPNGATAGGLSMARFEPGRDWHLLPVPQAIEALYAGTVIDGKLWFVARVGGITEATWQLVSTTDGESFDTSGPTIGLGPLDGVSFLGRVGGRWVAAAYNETGAGDGATAFTLRSSEDGVLWEDATVPAFDAALTIRAGASNGKLAIAIGFAGDQSPGNAFALRTVDGQTWEGSTFNVPLLDPTAAACWGSTCTVSGFLYDTEAPPVAWSTADGRTWTASSSATRPGIEYRGINHLIPYDGGILAMPSDGAWAFVSKDGVAWRAIAVLPARPAEPTGPTDIPDSMAAVAIAGDVVIGLVAPFGDDPPAYWRGSLAAMLAAP